LISRHGTAIDLLSPRLGNGRRAPQTVRREHIRKEERMTRNLKVLGLALMAICALGALMASAASAQQGKLTADGPVFLLGTDTVGGVNELIYPGLPATKCPGSHYKASSVGNQAVGIANGSNQFTVVPNYTACKVGIFPSTVVITTCDYRFTLGQTTGGVAHTYGVSASVECENGGDTIHIEVYSDEAHTKKICTVTFGAQTPTSELHATFNTATGKTRIHGAVKNIHANRTSLGGGAGGCPPSGTTTAAEYKVDFEVDGFNSAGGPTTASVSE
jgi:hypothetical protein